MLHLSATALLTLVPGPATPPPMTVVPPMFYSEIVKKSQQIVAGTVTASKCQYERGKETIATYVTFSGLTVYKGQVGKTMTLRLEGGSMGDDHLWVPLMPKFKVGSKYLVYVDGLSGKKVSPIVGFYQGAFEITQKHGRETLVSMLGDELIGIEKDRFVFAGKPTPKGNAPEAVEVPNSFKPADPNVDEIERAMVAKEKAETEAEQQAVRLPVVGYGDANVQGPASEAVFPIRFEEAPRKDASPIVIEAKSDTGVRMSARGLLSVAGEVR